MAAVFFFFLFFVFIFILLYRNYRVSFLGRGVFVIISLHMLLCIIMREFNVFSVTCQ